MIPNPSELVIIPNIFKKFPNIVAGVSTRHGGKSQFPFDSLNLGLHTSDSSSLVDQNLNIFCSQLDIPPTSLARSYQIHTDQIWVTTQAGFQTGFDAIISKKRGVYAAVSIADCCPILIVDPVKSIAAAVHAGWKGTVAQIVSQTAQKMIREYQSSPTDMLAYIGPCIGPDYFEVGPEVATHFEPMHKKVQGEKWLVDLKLANAHQLESLGIRQIEISNLCTIKDHALFFSHRKENGQTGRMLAIIGFRK